MSSENVKDLIRRNEISFQQILNKLLDKDNLELKTEISKPKQLAVLSVFSQYIKSFGFNLCSNLIDNFIKTYYTNMVSFNRKSRTEIIKALSSILKDNDSKTTIGKLTSTLD